MVFKWPLETGGLLPPRNSDGQLRVRSTKRQRQALGTGKVSGALGAQGQWC